MGIFDFMKDAGDKIFGRDNDDAKADVTRPLSSHLRAAGIDPSGIDIDFQGSTVILSGTVKSQDDREKAVLVVGNVQGVGRVDDRLRVARADADFSQVRGGADSTRAQPGSSQTVGHASAGGDGWTSRTYTVQSGDTLSKIAKDQYGDAGKYQRIFEANQPMLKDPDKIYPGQVLRIPQD
ncbi:MAG TPA: LysM and BON domain-containing protein [Vicinamibacterales bacterium]|nr:LysM and BON domain-containing protein [Vicinamibacterales bacterium]